MRTLREGIGEYVEETASLAAGASDGTTIENRLDEITNSLHQLRDASISVVDTVVRFVFNPD
jgi:hypothetical protein